MVMDRLWSSLENGSKWILSHCSKGSFCCSRFQAVSAAITFTLMVLCCQNQHYNLRSKKISDFCLYLQFVKKGRRDRKYHKQYGYKEGKEGESAPEFIPFCALDVLTTCPCFLRQRKNWFGWWVYRLFFCSFFILLCIKRGKKSHKCHFLKWHFANTIQSSSSRIVPGHVGASQAPILIRLRATLMFTILVCHFVCDQVLEIK